MDNNTKKQIKNTIIGVFTFITVFWTVMWSSELSRIPNIVPMPILWLIANASNLGLVLLTLPVLIYLLLDIWKAIKEKTPRPPLKYIPAIICIAITPRMYDPFSWVISFVGPP